MRLQSESTKQHPDTHLVYESVRLSLSTESMSHLAVFFYHNKITNSTFSHDFSAKRTDFYVLMGSTMVFFNLEVTSTYPRNMFLSQDIHCKFLGILWSPLVWRMDLF